MTLNPTVRTVGCPQFHRLTGSDPISEKIMCPACHKPNDIHKFCIYCGKRLPISDDQLELMTCTPQAVCLNCGRPVKKDQLICECGYTLNDIRCPHCNALNSYANRFCISCGEKLWTHSVNRYQYPERIFQHHLLNETPPYDLRNTAAYRRAGKGIGKAPLGIETVSEAESWDLDVERNLSEIGARWKIVSPNHCIKCLNIIRPDGGRCPNCGYYSSDEVKRITEIKNMRYQRPLFDDDNLKWTHKSKTYYQGSLAPAIGESQLDYRERLKWEFAENNYIKKIIKNIIKRKQEEALYQRQKAERQKRESERISQYGGGYCDSRCRHCFEELIDSGGGIVGDYSDAMIYEYYCQLGHTLSFGSYCEDYK